MPGPEDPESLVVRRADSPYWWYDFTIYGRRFRASTRSEVKYDAIRIAILAWNSAWAELMGGQHQGTGDDPQINIWDAFERYWSEHLQFQSQPANERERLARLLATFPPGLTLCQVKKHHIKSFVTARRTEVAPGTVNRALSLFRRMNNIAVEDWEKRGCSFRISKYMLPEPKGCETYLRARDVQAFLSHIAPHARAPVVLAMLTGLRRSNITNLRWREVDLAEKRITVHIKTRTNQRKPHCVTLAPQAATLLSVLRPAHSKLDDFVFFYRHPHVECDCSACRHRTDLSGKPIKDMKRTIGTATRKAGLTHIRFHDFRHTLASWVLNGGHSLKIVQELLGHSDIRTTQRYAHLERTVADRALEETIEKQEQAAGISFGTFDKGALPPPKRQRLQPTVYMAGAERLELTTCGFGDRRPESREPSDSGDSSECDDPDRTCCDEN